MHADAATAHGRHDAIARATRQHVTDAAHGILSPRLQHHRLNLSTITTTDAALLDRRRIVGTSLRFSVNATSYHGTVVAVGACRHESNPKLTSLLAYIDAHASPCTSHIHTADCIYTMPYDDAVYSQRHLSRGNIPDAEPLLARGRSSTSSFSSTISAAHSSESSESDDDTARMAPPTVLSAPLTRTTNPFRDNAKQSPRRRAKRTIPCTRHRAPLDFTTDNNCTFFSTATEPLHKDTDDNCNSFSTASASPHKDTEPTSDDHGST